MNKKITRALVSVSDKSGIVDFCRELSLLGVEILSTGGTAKILTEHYIDVTEVADYTGFPEMMDGRVKTLHPKIHGGILGRRGIDDAVMSANGIQPIDMVVVNLYPFENTVALPDCDLATAIENIDIGGPTMIRAAAKNYIDVAVLVDPSDYARTLNELKAKQGLSLQTRFNLALKCFQQTAHYDTAIASYLGNVTRVEFPETLNLQFYLNQPLRYGENPHQKGLFIANSPLFLELSARVGNYKAKNCPTTISPMPMRPWNVSRHSPTALPASSSNMPTRAVSRKPTAFSRPMTRLIRPTPPRLLVGSSPSIVKWTNKRRLK